MKVRAGTKKWECRIEGVICFMALLALEKVHLLKH